MVRGCQRLMEIGMSRCMLPMEIADEGTNVWFVERHPVSYSIAQGMADEIRIFYKGVSDPSFRPASLFLQSLWQIPMVKGDKWFDIGFQQSIHQPTVESKAGPMDISAASRKKPGPGYREAIGHNAHLFHQTHILRPAMVVIGGNISSLPIRDHSRSVAESIPNALALAVLIPGTFDLVCGSSRTPGETIWKG